MRRTAGREVGDELRVDLLDEVDPTRAAGSEHGKNSSVLVRESIKELGSLFHDGDIGTDVGIEDVVEA